MRISTPITILLVALAIGTTPARTAFAGQRGQRTPSERQAAASGSRKATVEPKVAQAVDNVIRPWMAEKQAPGVMVVVRHHERTEYFPLGLADRARGRPVTPDSIFELASITKVFATTSLAMEVEAGRMQLTDSVAKHIRHLQNHGGDIRLVTLEQLATHTSSLPRTPGVARPRQGWNKETTIEWAAHWRAPHPPGTKSLYSNVAVGLLGFAIADREEKPLIEVWREQFLNALGMNHTYFAIPQQDMPLVVQGYGPEGRPVPHDPIGGWPAGGRLSSSGRDMGEFLVANMGERPDHPRITKAMQFAQQPHFKVSPKMTQGLAWQRVEVEGDLVIDKNGGLDGTSTYIGFMPERHIGVVVMANRGKCEATGVGRKLLMALIAKEHQEQIADEEASQ